MSVAIPYLDIPGPLEERMFRLASFLGIECELVSLSRDHLDAASSVASMEHAIPASCDAIVISPQLFAGWPEVSLEKSNLPEYLLQRFRYIIVHGLRAEASASTLVKSFSEGQLTSVLSIDSQPNIYSFTEDRPSICESFSGLTLGRTNPLNDHVLQAAAQHPDLKSLIAIGNLPFMASVKTSHAEVLFIGSSDVADLDAEIGPEILNDHFSRLIPHAMALRHVAGDARWHPMPPRACIIIDDPLLRSNYGFLNFNSLLHLAQKHRFHVSIAFIPHNFQRNSPQIIEMFRNNPAQFSICFHGNDHTQGEFAAVNTGFLNTALSVADERMRQHYRTTGLPCNRVMVFPQGLYSAEAMRALQTHNFWAAVNTSPLPQGTSFRPKLRDLVQPAVLRSSDFPLFIRRHIEHTEEIDIALNCFFGKPTLLVTHHEAYASPQAICEVADKINKVAPNVQWCNLASVVSNSYLVKPESFNTYRILTYAPTVSITNDSETWRSYAVEWANEVNPRVFSHVAVGNSICNNFSLEGTSLRMTVKLAPESTQTLSARFQTNDDSQNQLDLSWRIRAYVRRRLSEIRDNHLSKNPATLNAAKVLQRRFLRM